MKPEQFIIGIIVFIGILGFTGNLLLSGTSEYNITTSDEFTKSLTGNNYSEYTQKVEELKVAATNDGFLAQFLLGSAVYNVVKSSFSQVGSLISNISSYAGIPTEVTALIIVIIIVLAIFGGIKFILNR